MLTNNDKKSPIAVQRNNEIEYFNLILNKRNEIRTTTRKQ